MAFFGKKNKKPLFGGNIEPSCSYCQNNGGMGDQVVCTLHCRMQDGKCKKYLYDPLKRDPRPAPGLRTAQFSQEDFKL